MTATFSSALITGASSGIGAAIAERLSRPGVRLVLGGRDAGRLADVAEACRRKGAHVETATVDVTDAVAMVRWVQEADAAQPLDLVIANAGISAESRPPGEESDLARRIYAINVLGMLNTVEPVLPAMRARHKGNICIVASIAGFVGLPRGPAYSGSKAAMIVHGEAWQRVLAPDGISVTVACPGYVRTPMTARHKFKMPFLKEPAEAARIILDAVIAGRARILFPWPLRLAVWMLALLPRSLTDGFVPKAAYDEN